MVERGYIEEKFLLSIEVVSVYFFVEFPDSTA